MSTTGRAWLQLAQSIRRLMIDCLDTYADGHPRLRIPVDKSHSERMIPLHPEAASALKMVIEMAKVQKAIARRDNSVGRIVSLDRGGNCPVAVDDRQ